MFPWMSPNEDEDDVMMDDLGISFREAVLHRGLDPGEGAVF